MATPNQAYVSNAVPFGGLFIDIYRDGGLLIQQARLESLTPTQNVVEGNRPDIDQGDNGWWLVNGSRTGSGVIQLATDATPTLQPGDYFDASIRRDAGGAGISERFVIGQVGDTIAANDYRKQNVNVRVDKFA